MVGRVLRRESLLLVELVARELRRNGGEGLEKQFVCAHCRRQRRGRQVREGRDRHERRCPPVERQVGVRPCALLDRLERLRVERLAVRIGRDEAALARCDVFRGGCGPINLVGVDEVLDRKSTRLNSSHRYLHSFPKRPSSDLSGWHYASGETKPRSPDAISFAAAAVQYILSA